MTTESSRRASPPLAVSASVELTGSVIHSSLVDHRGASGCKKGTRIPFYPSPPLVRSQSGCFSAWIAISSRIVSNLVAGCQPQSLCAVAESKINQGISYGLGLLSRLTSRSPNLSAHHWLCSASDMEFWEPPLIFQMRLDAVLALDCSCCVTNSPKSAG